MGFHIEYRNAAATSVITENISYTVMDRLFHALADAERAATGSTPWRVPTHYFHAIDNAGGCHFDWDDFACGEVFPVLVAAAGLFERGSLEQHVTHGLIRAAGRIILNGTGRIVFS